MRNNNTFTLQRVISIVLILAMLLSGIAQSGISFGHKEVQAQSDSPTITTSISTHHGAVMQDETNPDDTTPG